MTPFFKQLTVTLLAALDAAAPAASSGGAEELPLPTLEPHLTSFRFFRGDRVMAGVVSHFFVMTASVSWFLASGKVIYERFVLPPRQIEGVNSLC